MSSQTTRQGEALTVTEPGQSDKPYVEDEETARQWASFTRQMQKVGGLVDLEAEVLELKHPHPLKRKNSAGVLEVTDPDGVLVTFGLTLAGYGLLRFYRDGRYSLNANAMLYQVVCAAERRRLLPGERVSPYVALNRRVIITVQQGNVRNKGDKGGFFWNLTQVKPIAQAGFGEAEVPPTVPSAPTAAARSSASTTPEPPPTAPSPTAQTWPDVHQPPARTIFLEEAPRLPPAESFHQQPAFRAGEDDDDFDPDDVPF